MEDYFMISKERRFYVDIMAVHPEVTGSCNLVIVKQPDNSTVKFVVDCGLFQERQYSKNNEVLPFNPANIDFCLVTHNHVEHTGRLPFLVNKGYDKEIYMSKTTAKLLPLALEDSYRVLKDVAKRQNHPSLYNEGDVTQTIKLVHGCNYEETIQICPNIKATFFRNGHLMGATSILVQIASDGYEDINLFFTGDYNNKNMFFDVPELPKWVVELPLTVIQESTYGNMESREITKCFAENVLKSINKGGTVVAPVFSLGRAQEILYEIKCMQENCQLSVKVPIFLDGKLTIRYTNMYIKDGLDIKEEMWNFLPENLIFVDRTSRAEILESEEAKIILTSSGMGSYGPAQEYIPEYLTRENALIHFTGYTTEGTLGARLKEAEVGTPVQIGGTLVKKRAQVEYTTEYSAHAKADEMIDFLKKFKHLKLVLVNHGEANTKQIFAERIINEVDTERVGILGSGYFFRVNHEGLIKSLSTKFE